MEHHHHRRKKKGKIILAVVLTLLVIGIGCFYMDILPGSSVPSEYAPATTTPVVVKPKPPGEPKLSITPGFVVQGELAIITVEGLTTLTNIKSFTFNNRPLRTFIYDSYATAFLGVDLYAQTGTFPLVLTFKDGKEVKGELVIHERENIRKPFDIPEKLGGNTKESIKELISTLSAEGKIINAIPTSNKILWTEKFRSPLNNPLVVEDIYGYTRIMNNFTMPHKGTDLHADLGTPVYAMNTGIVRLVSNMRNYGNTIVIDHGAGIQTIYMHLSEMNVLDGQEVTRGDFIGKTGDTGYASNPHLHLTVRVWDVSIDPIKFLAILGSGN